MKLYDQGNGFALGLWDEEPKEIFDHKAASEAAKRGMKKAADHLAYWKVKADEWISYLEVGDTFTADSLVENIGLPTTEDGAASNNGVGAYINGLSKRGIIKAQGYTTSDRITNHSRVLRIWKVVRRT